jgi:O-antigen/teichoic acid export membrane protein
MTATPQAIETSSVGPAAVHPAAGILRGALALLSTQPLTWTASLLAATLLPRYLGARGLGEYTAAITLANLGAIVTSFGLPSFLVRQIAQTSRTPRSYIGAGIVVSAGVSLVAALVLSAVLPRTGLPVRPHLLQIVLGGMVFASIQTVVLAVLIGQERHGLYAWLNAGTAALPALVGLLVLASGGGIILFAAASVIVSALALGAGWAISGIRLNRRSFSPQVWRIVVQGGVPFLGWNLAVNVYGQVDQILLAVFTRAAEVGWYAAAYRIIAVPVFIPTLITTPLLPALSRRADDSELFARTLRGSFLVALVLTVPISAMIIALAPSVPAVLHWPAEFQHSIPLIMILALHQPFVAVDMVLATGLTALHREHRWLRWGLVAALLNPALNVIFIPLLERQIGDGAIAAAVITVGTELFMFGAALRLLPRGILQRATASVTAKIILSGALAWLAAAVIRADSLVLAAAAGGLTFVAAILVFRAISADDLRTLLSIAAAPLQRRLGIVRGDDACA